MNDSTIRTATEGTPRHSIGAVSRKTGLSIHVLRAWERRYGAVSPGRTRGRQRLYGDADIARLRLLRRVTESGTPIGRVAHLSTAELVTLIGADGGSGERRAPADGVEMVEEEDRATTLISRCLEAGERFDDDGIHAALRHAVGLGAADFVERIAGPLLVEAGERWHAGTWQVAQEHLVSANVRRVVQWLLDTIEVRGDAPLMVVTTAAGERHELGAMLAGVVAAAEGWRVVYPGPDMPAADIARVARVRDAAVVAVSLVYIEREDDALAELSALREALAPATMLFAGGRAVQGTLVRGLREAGVSVIPDLAGLRVALRALGGRRREAAGAAA